MSFDFGDDDDIEYDADAESLKYFVGQKVDSHSSFKKRPIFAYDYISLKRGCFCFNNKSLRRVDFRRYFKVVKYLSKRSINDVFDNSSREDRFHQIKLNQKPLLVNEIQKSLNIKGNFDYLRFPAVVQFGLHTDSLTITNSNGEKVFVGKSPRVFCLIGNNGVFHVLFLDFEHKFNKMAP
jgi:hypothetical protein